MHSAYTFNTCHAPSLGLRYACIFQFLRAILINVALIDFRCLSISFKNGKLHIIVHTIYDYYDAYFAQ